jgi:hypothetical protein
MKTLMTRMTKMEIGEPQMIIMQWLTSSGMLSQMIQVNFNCF